MKFTLSWLKRHLDTGAGAAEIAERLTALGLEVEKVEDRAAGLAPFTVGYVVEAKRHPNADRLSVCLVDTGQGIVQVVCGAPNARTGMKGVFAAAGTIIPGTQTLLTASTIRGVESNGMLCSMREMGLSDEHQGIIELPEDAPVGAPFARVMGLDDPIIDVAVTPNRPSPRPASGASSPSMRARFPAHSTARSACASSPTRPRSAPARSSSAASSKACATAPARAGCRICSRPSACVRFPRWSTSPTSFRSTWRAPCTCSTPTRWRATSACGCRGRASSSPRSTARPTISTPR
jgi:tRNA-binding EMAP/Myf-like protein